jgi:glyoxylase-like metal-dependent hydrolase (beta-lactamase superfamily II)
VILERSMHPDWLSNTWLVADEPGGNAVLIDTGGPAEPILARIEELKVTVTHALCTHHHVDHVANNDRYRRALGCSICGHAEERRRFGRLDMELRHGDVIRSGSLRVRCLHIPGHTLGQLAYVVDDACVFTGDTLFRGSVGGTRGPGHTTFADIKRSIMETLMSLPREMAVHPGHMDSTTIGTEWETNPFIRMWRGLDEQGTGLCSAMGRQATLVLRARDYDGGTKCWVRPEGGVDDIVPGSMVIDG